MTSPESQNQSSSVQPPDKGRPPGPPTPTASGHESETPREAPQPASGSALEAMRRRLLEHSPLEDLGPLFSPQARGQTTR